jgi:phosphohistidine phosphatase
MGILLVRHSDAVEGGGNIDDVARWLSGVGRKRAVETAQLVRAKALKLDRFVTSPRVRAVQTAELFAQVLGYRGEISSVPELSFTMPAKDAAQVLSGLKGNSAAFGHMPTIAEIVGLLSGGKAARGLSTSEAVWIEDGKLVWRVDAGG